MLKYVHGNLFNSPATTLVNPVNTVGVMGKGLALSFKKKYPNMFRRYRSLCQKSYLRIGQPYLLRSTKPNEKNMLLFPTKNKWWNKSKLSYIDSGMKFLTQNISKYHIKSLAFPALGAGLGGLDWKTQVKPLMTKYLKNAPVTSYVYAPLSRKRSFHRNTSYPKQHKNNYYWHSTKNVYYLDKNNNMQVARVPFKRVPGFSSYAKKQSVKNLHKAFQKQMHTNLQPLEISSVSNNPIGQQSSALHLQLYARGQDSYFHDTKPQIHKYLVEQLFQAGKEFKNHNGQYYQKLSALHTPGKFIKHNMRSTCGDKLVGFQMFGHKFPLTPKNYYYDWIYLHGMEQNKQVAEKIASHRAFTDFWETKRTVNTQAKSCAVLSSLAHKYGWNMRKVINNPKRFKDMEAKLDKRMENSQSKPRAHKLHRSFSKHIPKRNKNQEQQLSLNLGNQNKTSSKKQIEMNKRNQGFSRN